MRSFLISILAQKFKDADLETFKRQHPHDWLLWEPGTWKPPGRATLVIPPEQMKAVANKSGEGLAFVMVPKKAGANQLSLGRGDECDIAINDGTLSSMHLVFMQLAGGVWTVRDAGSRNGSSVDGLKLEAGKPQPLRNGARILAAQVSLTYYTPAGLLVRLRQ